MPAFREINTGQVVSHEDDALVAWFRDQARWEETADAPKEQKKNSRKTAAQKKAEAAEAEAAQADAPEADAAE